MDDLILNIAFSYARSNPLYNTVLSLFQDKEVQALKNLFSIDLCHPFECVFKFWESVHLKRAIPTRTNTIFAFN